MIGTKEKCCIQFSLLEISILLIITWADCSVQNTEIKPNITLTKYANTYICSSDTNVPLVFVTSQNSYMNKRTTSTYPKLDGLFKDFNCDFEDNSPCLRAFQNAHWSLSESGDHEINPVTDERWEKFAIRTSGRDSINEKIQVNNSNYVIALSVNSYKQPQIVLCEAMSENTQCIWITINEIDRDDVTVILRSCSELSLDPFSNEDSGCRRLATMQINEKSKPSWRHFLIYKQEDFMMFEETNRNDKLIGYRERIQLNTFQPKFVLKKILFKNAEWKEHKYKYLTFTTKNTRVQFGPTYKSKISGTLCISLYITMCITCEVSIEDDSSNNIKMIQNDLESIRPTWKNIKFFLRVQKESEYKFYMFGINKNENQKSFWAIDNVRLCQDNEVRDVTLNADEELSNITCQALGYPNWKATLAGTYETGTNTIENISTVWIDNKLHLKWRYFTPNTNEKNVNFHITITKINSAMDELTHFTPINKLYNIDYPEQQEYCFKIENKIPHSSSYRLTICVKENCFINKVINSPPSKPALVNQISIKNEEIDKTINLTIPSFDFTTRSQYSYIYVVVCEIFGDVNVNLSHVEKLYVLIKHNINCHGDFWIAAELMATNETTHFRVGDATIIYSNNFATPLINKPLNSGKTYSYHVVLMNVYKDESTFSSQNIEEQHGNRDQKYYFVLYAILIICVASIFWTLKQHNIFKKCKKQKPNENQTSLEEIEIPESTAETTFTSASTLRRHEEVPILQTEAVIESNPTL